jgi:glyoxylase-like metal-dependent hydrolase (beta-lactamase superfamily II)
MRCLLVEHDDGLVLIDTGLGDKEDAKFRDLYGVDNAPSEGSGHPDRLHEAIHAAGFSPSDVSVVIDTHLHFDHAGGNTHADGEGRVHLSFPNATYHVQRGEWEWAHRANERTSASYLPHNFDPVMEAGRFVLDEGDAEILPGISVYRTPGHCPGHQSVILASEGQTACFLADVIPTMAHLPLPWVMGYDVEPLVTLESKRALLRRAVDERWLLVSTHDPFVPWGYVGQDGKGVRLEAVEG